MFALTWLSKGKKLVKYVSALYPKTETEKNVKNKDNTIKELQDISSPTWQLMFDHIRTDEEDREM